MEYKLKVVYLRLNTSKSVSLPVCCSVEQENISVTRYHCRVDLPTNEIPEWVTPEFNIRKVHNSKITSTKITPMDKHWSSPDAALFADETAKTIRFRETAERLRG